MTSPAGIAQAPAAAAPPAIVPAEAPATRSVARRVRFVLAWVPPAVVVGWVVWRWPVVRTGLNAIEHANHGWLLVAGAAAGATWIAGAACQQGAVLVRLPIGRLLAVQLAGSLANHLLPAGIGVGAVNLRFLRRCGMTRPQALGAVTLNTTVGAVIHLLLLAGLIVLAPVAVPLPHMAGGIVTVVAAGAAAMVIVVLATRPGLRRTIAVTVAERWADLRVVLVRPTRAALLWGGSAAVPVLHAFTLAAVIRALDLHISTLDVLTAYFAATTAAALVPSPGGLGALDLTLGVALTAYGVGLAPAVTAVVGYRLITTWMPLVPSAVTFTVLVRRRVM